MKNALTQFVGSTISSEVMKNILGGKAACTIYFDTDEGCESWAVSFSGTQSDAVNYADRTMASGAASGYRVTC